MFMAPIATTIMTITTITTMFMSMARTATTRLKSLYAMP